MIKNPDPAKLRCPKPRSNNEHGVAIILVIFVVSLASILVVNLTYTASLEARSNLAVERGLQAEYLLKSALSMAQALIQIDATPEVDGIQDLWAKFYDGAPVPLDLLGLQDPALSIQLEIRPVESKILLRPVLEDKRWRFILARLFQKLGFDNDQEEDHTGLLPGRVIKSNDLVAGLIDYMDSDDKSFRSDDFPGIGFEEQLPKDTFPNRRIRRVSELATIPGFTPNRIRLMTPFVRGARGGNDININLAPLVVLDALSDDLGEAELEQIDAFRKSENGPFAEKGIQLKDELTNLIGAEISNEISRFVNSDSKYFQVIAKVDYGASIYFMRAYLWQHRGLEVPEIRSVEFF